MKTDTAHNRSRQHEPRHEACGSRADTFTAVVPALPRIAVDTREQCPLEFQHFPTERGTLATGDYGLAALPRLMSIERKSMADLIGSLTTERDRFERELDRMGAYPLRRLLVVGTISELYSLLARRRATVSSIIGSIMAIDATRVPVVRVDNPTVAAAKVETWAWYAWRDYWKPIRRLETPDFINTEPFTA